MRSTIGFFCLLTSCWFLTACVTEPLSLPKDPKRKRVRQTYGSWQPTETEEKGYRSSRERKHSWKNRYTNISGYFKRPPLFSNPNEAAVYDRCAQVKIVEVLRKNGKISLNIQQKGRSFHIIGLDRKKFFLEGNRITSLDSYFVKRLDVLRGARHLAQSKAKLCRGQMWKAMGQEQFLFVNGLPDKVIKGTGQYQDTYQWIYKNSRSGDSRSYYFTKGSLSAWSE